MKREKPKREGHVSLPDELAIELLARLSAKILFHFTCVSKKWRSFIGYRYFIEAHRTHNRSSSLLLTVTKLCFYYSSLRAQGPENFIPRLNLFFSSSSGYKGVTDVVKGLPCFYGHNNGSGIAVANITTGEIKDLLNDDSRNHAATTTDYHLRFDPVNGVFKLTKTRRFPRSDSSVTFDHLKESFRSFFHNFDDLWEAWMYTDVEYSWWPSECEILTLGRDFAWRKLHGDASVWLGGSIYVNGAAYWLSSYTLPDRVRWVLVSFDFNREVFRFILIPP